MDPAVAVLEFSSVAAGIEAGDAMVKRAPLQAIRTGTVQPGKFLVLVAGDTASVDESLEAGQSVGGAALIDTVYLPDIHPDVVSAIRGARRNSEGEALGVIETLDVASTIRAADSGRKAADVSILHLGMADGLGGKGYLLLSGTLSEVEVAVDAVSAVVTESRLVRRVVIAQLHDEMRADIIETPFFWEAVAEVGE